MSALNASFIPIASPSLISIASSKDPLVMSKASLVKSKASNVPSAKSKATSIAASVYNTPKELPSPVKAPASKPVTRASAKNKNNNYVASPSINKVAPCRRSPHCRILIAGPSCVKDPLIRELEDVLKKKKAG